MDNVASDYQRDLNQHFAETIKTLTQIVNLQHKALLCFGKVVDAHEAILAQIAPAEDTGSRGGESVTSAKVALAEVAELERLMGLEPKGRQPPIE